MDIYHRLDQAVVTEDPFPHIVLEEALDPGWCDVLIRELPPLGAFTRGAAPESNKRFTLSHADLLPDPSVSEAWKETIRQGMTQRFLDRVLHHFAPHVRREYPDFEARYGPVEALAALPRQRLDRPLASVGLDAQLAVNTPAQTSGTTVQVPHLDWMAKLFSGLLYLRRPDDDSVGGDLELYACDLAAPEFDEGRQLGREVVRTVRTIPYRRNTLALFLNTPRSLHGVTPRGSTPHPRHFVNLVGEMPAPLFDVRRASTSPHARTGWRRRVGAWLGR